VHNGPGGDIFLLDKLFIPINHPGVHWALVCVFVLAKTICYYDSLGEVGGSAVSAILKYLEWEHMRKYGKELPQGWRLIPDTPCPRQDNGNDCGVYICMFMDYLSLGRPLDVTRITHDEVNIGYRKHIAASIIRGALPVKIDNYT